MNFYSVSPFIISLLLISLGIFVYFKNKEKTLNKIFFLLCLVSFIWLFFYSFGYTCRDDRVAFLLFKIGYCGVVFIAITVFHFTLELLMIKSKLVKILVILAYLMGFTWTILIWGSLNLIKGVREFFWGYYPQANYLHPLFLVLFLSLVGTSVTLLLYFWAFKNKRKATIENARIKYMLLAFFIYNFASIDFLPNYGIEIYPFGFIPTSLFFIIIAYAIVRYRLMDINIALTRAGIFVIVYSLVLGIPFGVMVWSRQFIEGLGYYGMLLPLLLGMSLASVGPFIYLFLQRRAEDILLKDQRRYQRTLMELSRTMTRIRDLEQLLKAIVLTVVNTVKVSYAAIYLKDEEYKSYKLKQFYPKKEQSRFQELISSDSGLIKVLHQGKRPLTQEEIGSAHNFALDSGLVIPCFMEDDLLGFMVLGAKQNNQVYTPDDVIVFETLSYATSLAIENSTFWKQIEERQRLARIEEMNLFSYSLAHEIDNPMTIIIGQANKIKRAYLDDMNLSQEQKEELKTTLDYISEAAWRVSGMVKAIQEFGQKTSSEFKPMKLEEAIENYLKLYTAHFKMNGVYFTKEVPQNLPMLRADKHGIEELFVILSNNAVHAVKEMSVKKINLKVETANADWIKIAFSDNGYGIAKEKIETIFAPFVTTKASSEGTGMGLYNAKNIIARHKGRIWAESEGEGKGATFFIELPIAKDIKPEELKGEDKDRRLF